QKQVTEELAEHARSMLRGNSKVDRDVPTYIRKQQRDSLATRDLFGDDEQFDIPTFLRKRVD
ncbi:MAG TPA: cell division protein FtsZ, partial [Geopsychrobacteraceae bacterium]